MKQPCRSFSSPGEEVGCGDAEGRIRNGYGRDPWTQLPVGTEAARPSVERISIFYGLFFFQRDVSYSENNDAHPCDLFVI